LKRHPQQALISSEIKALSLLAEAPRLRDTVCGQPRVEADELRSAGPMVNLSESLNRVPGIVADLRNNQAQDLPISSRGFGACATFGIRGLRLYTDGIPASMPDGQGQVSHFDLAGAAHRGAARPFSALYGANSAA
jgi:iron complex outermembrane receptor protein